MTAVAALLTVALLQQAPPPRPLERIVDVIELERGGQLEGRIVEEAGDYVQIELSAGMVVGFERSKISRITRGVPSSDPGSAPPEDGPVLRPREEWFVLHDADGRVIGRLHGTVTADDEGLLRIGEEWEFREGAGRTAITRLEIVTARLDPVSAFYHERQLRGDGRTLKDRLVRATVEGGDFVVEKQTMVQRDRRVYAFDPTLRLPLAVLEALRQEPYHRLEITHDVFDAGQEAFARRAFRSGRPRTVVWRDETIEVHEVAYEHNGVHNTEWIDAAGRTIRREVNGPSLVAVRVPDDATERYLMARDPVFPAAVAVESESRFALWLPNPSWRLRQVEEPGQVTAEEAVEGATACLMSFEQLEPDLLIDSVADAVIRWLRVAKPGLEMAARDHVRVRDRTAVRLDALYARGPDGREEKSRCEVFVFSVDGRHMALCFDAPVSAFERLRSDFTRMLDSIELHPQCLAPAPGDRAGQARSDPRPPGAGSTG